MSKKPSPKQNEKAQNHNLNIKDQQNIPSSSSSTSCYHQQSQQIVNSLIKLLKERSSAEIGEIEFIKKNINTYSYCKLRAMINKIGDLLFSKAAQAKGLQMDKEPIEVGVDSCMPFSMQRLVDFYAIFNDNNNYPKGLGQISQIDMQASIQQFLLKSLSSAVGNKNAGNTQQDWLKLMKTQSIENITPVSITKQVEGDDQKKEEEGQSQKKNENESNNDDDKPKTFNNNAVLQQQELRQRKTTIHALTAQNYRRLIGSRRVTAVNMSMNHALGQAISKNIENHKARMLVETQAVTEIKKFKLQRKDSCIGIRNTYINSMMSQRQINSNIRNKPLTSNNGNNNSFRRRGRCQTQTSSLIKIQSSVDTEGFTIEDLRREKLEQIEKNKNQIETHKKYKKDLKNMSQLNFDYQGNYIKMSTKNRPKQNLILDSEINTKMDQTPKSVLRQGETPQSQKSTSNLTKSTHASKRIKTQEFPVKNPKVIKSQQQKELQAIEEIRAKRKYAKLMSRKKSIDAAAKSTSKKSFSLQQKQSQGLKQSQTQQADVSASLATYKSLTKQQMIDYHSKEQNRASNWISSKNLQNGSQISYTSQNNKTISKPIKQRSQQQIIQGLRQITLSKRIITKSPSSNSVAHDNNRKLQTQAQPKQQHIINRLKRMSKSTTNDTKNVTKKTSITNYDNSRVTHHHYQQQQQHMRKLSRNQYEKIKVASPAPKRMSLSVLQQKLNVRYGSTDKESQSRSQKIRCKTEIDNLKSSQTSNNELQERCQQKLIKQQKFQSLSLSSKLSKTNNSKATTTKSKTKSKSKSKSKIRYPWIVHQHHQHNQGKIIIQDQSRLLESQLINPQNRKIMIMIKNNQQQQQQKQQQHVSDHDYHDDYHDDDNDTMIIDIDTQRIIKEIQKQKKYSENKQY